MRCRGFTRTFTRCQRDCRFVFCHQHRILGWLTIISFIALLGGLYQDVLNPLIGVLAEDPPPATAVVELHHDDSAPLRLHGIVKPGSFPNGSTVGDITWYETYTPVEIVITNTSETEVSTLELRMTSDTAIVDGTQLTQLPGVSVYAMVRQSGIEPLALSGTDSNGKPVTVPLVPTHELTSTYGITCPTLHQGTTLRILLATVALNVNDGQLPSGPLFVKRPPVVVTFQGSYELAGMSPRRRYEVNFSLRASPQHEEAEAQR